MRQSFEKQGQYDDKCTATSVYTDFVVERAIYAILLSAENIGLIHSTLSDINIERMDSSPSAKPYLSSRE